MLRKLAAALFLCAAGGPAGAATQLNWWHAMTGVNNTLVVELANTFNASQADYKVVPIYKGDYADTMNAGIAAFKAGNAPHILQVFDVGTATMMATKGVVKPVFDLMRETGEPFDPKSYLPAVTNYYSTVAGEMLSLPFNSSSMVLWVNQDALRKAGVKDVPQTWPQVFAAARKLRASVSPTCGFSAAWITWAVLEQFSAWHNLPFATKANGLDSFEARLVFNGTQQARLLRELVELQKDRSFDYSGRVNKQESRFTSGECPLFLTSSGFYGQVKANAAFAYTATAMPYYDDVAGAPRNSIIGGASLWVMGGKSFAEYRGVAKFMTFLSDTDRQVELHRVSGYLPITRAAYEKSRSSGVYAALPLLEVPMRELTNQAPTDNSRGIRLGNMSQLRDVWAEEIEDALSGRKTAEAALDSAVARGNAMLRQFERVVTR